jgi:hypothetical protein
MTLNFNPELDHRDFIFAIAPDSHTYIANLYFKIDDDGNYVTKCDFKFTNSYKNVVDMDGFVHTFEESGKWSEATKTKTKKVFYIKSETSNPNILPIESCFSSISVAERQLLLRTSKNLEPHSNILEISSGLGGRATILARGNKYANVHCVEIFSPESLRTQFNSTLPWIKGQLFDMCKVNDMHKDTGYVLLDELHKDFEQDSTGKLAWKRITSKYPNITLHESVSHTNFSDWTTMVDVLLINVHKDPEFLDNLLFWTPHLKSNGVIISHLYDRVLGPAVFHEINHLISQGWKIVDRVDQMIIIQKP